MKALILYYSYSYGNTKGIAKRLAAVTSSDIEHILLETPYEGGKDFVLEKAKRQAKNKSVPKIKPIKHSLKNYDVIILGTPTWWYTMAPAVRTFLRKTDLKGKILIPYCTHGGWPSHTIKDMEAETNADKVVLAGEFQYGSEEHPNYPILDQQALEKWILNVRSFLKTNKL